MYCGQCGTKVGGDQRFCHRCGAAVGAAIEDSADGQGLRPSSAAPRGQRAIPSRPRRRARPYLMVAILVFVLSLLAAAMSNPAAPRAAIVAHPSLPSAGTVPGLTPKGCMVGTHGHSVVMVYSEETSPPSSECRHVAKGDSLYTRAPDIATLTHYCTATKRGAGVILDVFDKRDDMALPKHPEAGTVGNVVCAIFQGNDQWSVARNMAEVPTYIPSTPLPTVVPVVVVHAQHDARSRRADLTAVDWADSTYVAPCDPEHPQSVTVKKGSAKVGDFTFEVYNPTYGDLTGDGRPEAAVGYSCSGADFGGVDIAVYTGDSAHPRLIGDLPRSIQGQGPASVSTVAIHGKIITLSGIGYTNAAPHCCPDLTVTATYQWDGKAFTEVDSQAVPLATQTPSP